MTLCYEVEEETDEEGDSKEDCSRETDKTVATLEAMLICLSWGYNFSFPDETHQRMVVTLHT